MLIASYNNKNRSRFLKLKKLFNFSLISVTKVSYVVETLSSKLKSSKGEHWSTQYSSSFIYIKSTISDQVTLLNIDEAEE